MEYPNLKDIRLDGCATVDYEVVIAIATNYPKLEKLDISSCQALVGDAGLAAIILNCKNLHWIGLVGFAEPDTRKIIEAIPTIKRSKRGSVARIYDGEWISHKMDGQGKLTLPDGTMYKGGWKNNLMDGQGKYTWANRNVYKGDWKKGSMEGQVKFTWANGTVYEGDCKNGSMEGHGKYTFPDGGGVYEGDWKNGLM